MKAKEYLLLGVILAACLIAVFVPIIASGSLTQKFYDRDLRIPKRGENVPPSALGLKRSPTPSAVSTTTASPTATPSVISLTAATSTFTLNLPPTSTPTAPIYPSWQTGTREPSDRPEDPSSPIAAPTHTAIVNPPTNPPPTNPPPTSPPPTNPPPTNPPTISTIIATIIPLP